MRRKSVCRFQPLRKTRLGGFLPGEPIDGNVADFFHHVGSTSILRPTATPHLRDPRLQHVLGLVGHIVARNFCSKTLVNVVKID